MPKPHNIASFVLRFTQELWQDTNGEPHIRWRGHIRHVQGNEEERFTDFTQAVSFMQHFLTALTVETFAGAENMSQEKVFQESLKWWDNVAANYAKIMSQAVEQSFKQSETFREQMDEASKKMLAAWGFPVQKEQQQELVESLKALQQQIKTLADRVESLEKQLQQAQK